LAVLAWAILWGGGLGTLKLTWHLTPFDLALVLGSSLPVFLCCLLYRSRFWPVQHLASPGAHLVEDAYFLLFNSPAEELFFRGMLQTLAMQALPPLLGFTAVALVFGFYHRAAGFPLPFLILASAGGVLFGLLFLASSSILVPILVHFVADLALFNLGPTLLARQTRAKPEQVAHPI